MRKSLRKSQNTIMGAGLIVAVLVISLIFGLGLISQTTIENPLDETTTTETTPTTTTDPTTTPIPEDNTIIIGIVLVGGALGATAIIIFVETRTKRRRK